MSTGWLWVALFVAFNAAVACSDWRARRVPNRLLLAAWVGQACWLAATAMPAVQLQGPGAAGISQALAGLALGLAVFLPLWRGGFMGAGDVKYLAVLGWLLGPLGLFIVAVAGNLVGGVHALYRWVRPAASGRRNQRLPHAVHLAVAAGAWLAWRLHAAW